MTDDRRPPPSESCSNAEEGGQGAATTPAVSEKQGRQSLLVRGNSKDLGSAFGSGHGNRPQTADSKLQGNSKLPTPESDADGECAALEGATEGASAGEGASNRKPPTAASGRRPSTSENRRNSAGNGGGAQGNAGRGSGKEKGRTSFLSVGYAAKFGRLSKYDMNGLDASMLRLEKKKSGPRAITPAGAIEKSLEFPGINKTSSSKAASADGSSHDTEAEEEVIWQDWLTDLDHIEWSIASCLRGFSFLMTKTGTIQTLERNRFIVDPSHLMQLDLAFDESDEDLCQLLCAICKMLKSLFHQVRKVLIAEIGTFNQVLRKFDGTGDRWIDFQEFYEITRKYFFPTVEKGFGQLDNQSEQRVQQRFLANLFAAFTGAPNQYYLKQSEKHRVSDIITILTADGEEIQLLTHAKQKLRVDKFASALSLVSESQLYFFRLCILDEYHSFNQAFNALKTKAHATGGLTIEFIARDDMLKEYVRIHKKHTAEEPLEKETQEGSDIDVEETTVHRAERINYEAERFYDYMASFGMYEETALPGQIDGITFEAFLTAMSIVSPGIDIAQFRKRLLVRYGNWKNAFAGIQAKADKKKRLQASTETESNTLAVPGGRLRVSDQGGSDLYIEEWELFEQFGGKLDFNREDALAFFTMLDIDGDGTVTWDEFKERLIDSGLGFSIEEFCVRMWRAADAGVDMSKIFDKLSLDPGKHLLKAEFAADLFGIYLSQEIENRYSRKSYLSARKNQIPCIPKLSRKEATMLYDQLYMSAEKVTINVLKQALGTHCSDVLTTTEQRFNPGETATIAYRIPKKLVNDCGKMPFIAVVTSECKWTQAGGGGWQLRGQNIAELSKSKVQIQNFPRQLSGNVTLQIPYPQDGPAERYEFRLFSSANGYTYGKQVGQGINFNIQGPRPGRPIVSSMAPTSCSISWTPCDTSNREKSFGEVVEYVVKIVPDIEIMEDSTRLSREKFSIDNRWNALKSNSENVCVFDIEGLTPGLQYKFNVLPRHKVPIAKAGFASEGESPSKQAAGAEEAELETGDGGDPLDQTMAGVDPLEQTTGGCDLEQTMKPSLLEAMTKTDTSPKKTEKWMYVDGNLSLPSISYRAPTCLQPTQPGQPRCIKITTEECIFQLKEPGSDNLGSIFAYEGYYYVGKTVAVKDMLAKIQFKTTRAGSRTLPNSVVGPTKATATRLKVTGNHMDDWHQFDFTWRIIDRAGVGGKNKVDNCAAGDCKGEKKTIELRVRPTPKEWLIPQLRNGVHCAVAKTLIVRVCAINRAGPSVESTPSAPVILPYQPSIPLPPEGFTCKDGLQIPQPGRALLHVDVPEAKDACGLTPSYGYDVKLSLDAIIRKKVMVPAETQEPDRALKEGEEPEEAAAPVETIVEEPMSLVPTTEFQNCLMRKMVNGSANLEITLSELLYNAFAGGNFATLMDPETGTFLKGEDLKNVCTDIQLNLCIRGRNKYGEGEWSDKTMVQSNLQEKLTDIFYKVLKFKELFEAAEGAEKAANAAREAEAARKREEERKRREEEERLRKEEEDRKAEEARKAAAAAVGGADAAAGADGGADGTDGLSAGVSGDRGDVMTASQQATAVAGKVEGGMATCSKDKNLAAPGTTASAKPSPRSQEALGSSAGQAGVVEPGADGSYSSAIGQAGVVEPGADGSYSSAVGQADAGGQGVDSSGRQGGAAGSSSKDPSGARGTAGQSRGASALQPGNGAESGPSGVSTSQSPSRSASKDPHASGGQSAPGQQVQHRSGGAHGSASGQQAGARGQPGGQSSGPGGAAGGQGAEGQEGSGGWGGVDYGNLPGFATSGPDMPTASEGLAGSVESVSSLAPPTFEMGMPTKSPRTLAREKIGEVNVENQKGFLEKFGLEGLADSTIQDYINVGELVFRKFEYRSLTEIKCILQTLKDYKDACSLEVVDLDSFASVNLERVLGPIQSASARAGGSARPSPRGEGEGRAPRSTRGSLGGGMAALAANRRMTGGKVGNIAGSKEAPAIAQVAVNLTYKEFHDQRLAIWGAPKAGGASNLMFATEICKKLDKLPGVGMKALADFFGDNLFEDREDFTRCANLYRAAKLVGEGTLDSEVFGRGSISGRPLQKDDFLKTLGSESIEAMKILLRATEAGTRVRLFERHSYHANNVPTANQPAAGADGAGAGATLGAGITPVAGIAPQAVAQTAQIPVSRSNTPPREEGQGDITSVLLGEGAGIAVQLTPAERSGAPVVVPPLSMNVLQSARNMPTTVRGATEIFRSPFHRFSALLLGVDFRKDLEEHVVYGGAFKHVFAEEPNTPTPKEFETLLVAFRDKIKGGVPAFLKLLDKVEHIIETVPGAGGFEKPAEKPPGDSKPGDSPGAVGSSVPGAIAPTASKTPSKTPSVSPAKKPGGKPEPLTPSKPQFSFLPYIDRVIPPLLSTGFTADQLEKLLDLVQSLGGYETLLALLQDVSTVKRKLFKHQTFRQFVKCVDTYFGGSGYVLLGMDILKQSGDHGSTSEPKASTRGGTASDPSAIPPLSTGNTKAEPKTHGHDSFHFAELCVIMQHLAPRPQDLTPLVQLLDNLGNLEHDIIVNYSSDGEGIHPPKGKGVIRKESPILWRTLRAPLEQPTKTAKKDAKNPEENLSGPHIASSLVADTHTTDDETSEGNALSVNGFTASALSSGRSKAGIGSLFPGQSVGGLAVPGQTEQSPFTSKQIESYNNNGIVHPPEFPRFLLNRGTYTRESANAIGMFMLKLKQCGADLGRLFDLLNKICAFGGDVAGALEMLDLIQPLLNAKEYLPKDKSVTEAILPQLLKGVHEAGGMEWFQQDVLHPTNGLTSLHWKNAFDLGKQVLKVTTAGEARASSDRNFQFYIRNLGPIHEAFYGVDDALKNCLAFLDECKLIGSKNIRYACTLQPAHMLGDGRAEFQPMTQQDLRSRSNSPERLAAKREKDLAKSEGVSLSPVATELSGALAFTISAPAGAKSGVQSDAVRAKSVGINAPLSMTSPRPGSDQLLESDNEDAELDERGVASSWMELAKVIREDCKGPAFFLKCVKGANLMEFLLSVDALKICQLVQTVDSDDLLLPVNNAEVRAFERIKAGILPEELITLLGCEGYQHPLFGKRDDYNQQGDFPDPLSQSSAKPPSDSDAPGGSTGASSSGDAKSSALGTSGQVQASTSFATAKGQSIKRGPKSSVSGDVFVSPMVGQSLNESMKEIKGEPQLVGLPQSRAKPRPKSSLHDLIRHKLGRFTPLKAFLRQVYEQGGAEVFLWLVKGIDLSHVKAQLFSVNLLRQNPATRNLFDSEALRGQFVRLLDKLEECGGVSKALDILDKGQDSGHPRGKQTPPTGLNTGTLQQSMMLNQSMNHSLHGGNASLHASYAGNASLNASHPDTRASHIGGLHASHHGGHHHGHHLSGCRQASKDGHGMQMGDREALFKGSQIMASGGGMDRFMADQPPNQQTATIEVEKSTQFYHNAGQILCERLNITMENEGLQTVAGICDFWKALMSGNDEPQQSAVGHVNSRKSRYKKDKSGKSATLSKMRSQVHAGEELLPPKIALPDRIPLEELEILTKFIASVRVYMHGAMQQMNQGSVAPGGAAPISFFKTLGIWFKFMRKVEFHDVNFLKKIEKFLYFKNRSYKNSLDVFTEFRQRYPKARLEEWKLLLERMSTVVPGSDDLSQVVKVISEITDAMNAKSTVRPSSGDSAHPSSPSGGGLPRLSANSRKSRNTRPGKTLTVPARSPSSADMGGITTEGLFISPSLHRQQSVQSNFMGGNSMGPGSMSQSPTAGGRLVTLDGGSRGSPGHSRGSPTSRATKQSVMMRLETEDWNDSAAGSATQGLVTPAGVPYGDFWNCGISQQQAGIPRRLSTPTQQNKPYKSTSFTQKTEEGSPTTKSPGGAKGAGDHHPGADAGQHAGAGGGIDLLQAFVQTRPELESLGIRDVNRKNMKSREGPRYETKRRLSGDFLGFGGVFTEDSLFGDNSGWNKSMQSSLGADDSPSRFELKRGYSTLRGGPSVLNPGPSTLTAADDEGGRGFFRGRTPSPEQEDWTEYDVSTNHGHASDLYLCFRSQQSMQTPKKKKKEKRDGLSSKNSTRKMMMEREKGFDASTKTILGSKKSFLDPIMRPDSIESKVSKKSSKSTMDETKHSAANQSTQYTSTTQCSSNSAVSSKVNSNMMNTTDPIRGSSKGHDGLDDSRGFSNKDGHTPAIGSRGMGDSRRVKTATATGGTHGGLHGTSHGTRAPTADVSNNPFRRSDGFSTTPFRGTSKNKWISPNWPAIPVGSPKNWRKSTRRSPSPTNDSRSRLLQPTPASAGHSNRKVAPLAGSRPLPSDILLVGNANRVQGHSSQAKNNCNNNDNSNCRLNSNSNNPFNSRGELENSITIVLEAGNNGLTEIQQQQSRHLSEGKHSSLDSKDFQVDASIGAIDGGGSTLNGGMSTYQGDSTILSKTSTSALSKELSHHSQSRDHHHSRDHHQSRDHSSSREHEDSREHGSKDQPWG